MSNNVYIGICVDNCDPLQAGRIRCRIFGIHSPSVEDIPICDLPWFLVLQSSSQSSVAGAAPAIVTGSWCILLEISTDATKQDFIVLGTIPGLVGETNGNQELRNATANSGFSDPFGVFPKFSDRQSNVSFPSREDKWQNHPTYVERSRTRVQHIPMAKRYPTNTVHNSFGPFEREKWNENEPRGKQDSYYPFNETRESPGGHVFEVDSTPSSQRVTNMNPSGTYEEILVNGERTVKVVSDNYEIVLGDNFMFVNGNLNITVAGDCRKLVKGDYILEVAGDYYESVIGDKYHKYLTSEYKEVYCNQVTNINKSRHTSIHGDDILLVDKSISNTANVDIIQTAFDSISYIAQTGDFSINSCGNIAITSNNGSAQISVCDGISLKAENGILEAIACDNLNIRSKKEHVRINAEKNVYIKGTKIYLN